MSAVNSLKAGLAFQYAEATDNNRQINKRREKRRSIAGLLTIFSVVSTLMLVELTLATYTPVASMKVIPDGPPSQSVDTQGSSPSGPPASPTSPTSSDARSH